MSTEAFWEPTQIGALSLPHRLALAPMTRSRAQADGTPTELNALYYAQRASTALVITEGVQPSDDGQGYLVTPGIYTDEHIAGWRHVTDSVHDAGGWIVIQLMHVGRIAHPDNTPHGRRSVAPSAIAPAGKIFTAEGMLDMPEPRAMSTDEVAQTVQDFRHAAASAIAAGADGVEIHGANGYLVHQFLSTNANRRMDRYGGSIENRIRFAVEVAGAIADEIGADRTGIQISPGNPFNDMVEDDTAALYGALLRALASLELAYLNVAHQGDEQLLASLRRDWPGNLVLNRGSADLETRAKDLVDGTADLVTAGRMALANPDLVDRVKAGAALNEPDPSTFYGGDERGYTDYPTMERA